MIVQTVINVQAGIFIYRGLVKKFRKVLLHTAKMIDPSVKSQARGQNNGSRALK